MSRIGRKPIAVPSGASVDLDGSVAVVRGPKGTLRIPLPEGVRLERQSGHVVIGRTDDQHAALHGLGRSLIANAVHGVTEGFEKHLDIVGIGYRAEVKGKAIVLNLGFSHPVEFALPDGVSA